MEPKLKVVFYANENGKEPVREWFKSLNKEEKRIIGNDLKTVQFGWPIGMPLVRNIGDKLWELRSTIPKGITRILFVAVDGNIVLLHAFIKKTQKIPTQEREIAIKRLKQMENQNE